MRCCVPFCRSTADNAAGADEVTFHDFPSDATVRMKWLRALGKNDQPLEDSAVVCSLHFLDDDFCILEDGSRQVRFSVIPSTIKLCMICLDTDRNVVSFSKYNLEEAYEKLTGHSICGVGYLKHTLCLECAQRLINFKKFRSKSLRACSAMMDLVKMHETITMQHITQIKNMREQLQSNIVKTLIAPDHCDLHIKDYNYEDTQTDNIVAANDAVKVEKTNAMWVDIKIEKEDPVERVDNISDAGVLIDVKLETITFECPVCFKIFSSEDAYNAHHHDARHAECGSEERDTQLTHRTHTALHSQHRDTNQVWDGVSSADYPHTSAKLFAAQLYELALEKNNTPIESEPKYGETANDQTLNPVNKTNFNFVEIVTDKFPAIKDITVAELLNRKNFRQEYFCEHCEYKCSKRDNIVNHLKIHTIDERLSCSSYDLPCKSSLASHMKVHSVEKPFSCKFCDYASRKKGDLIGHMRIHTGEKPFSCKLCEYACTQKGTLVSHMRIHTGEKPFSCTLCEYACRTKGDLVGHMRIHTGEKPYSCTLCEYACRTKGDLIRHMKIHTGEKPYSCTLCEYACRTKGHLVTHMLIHTGEKPFSCKLCDYTCRAKGNLVRHKRIHTGEKPFSCTLCEYACRTKGDLVRHMTVHTDEKPFSCKLCDYKCRRKGYLVSHMRTHAGDKPCKL